MKPHASPIAILAALTLSMLALPLAAGVPGTLTYQGLLTDENGTPVTQTLPIAFRLYNAVDAADPIWAETQTVPVLQGRLSAVLGGDQSNPLPVGVLTASGHEGNTWIELQPDGDGDGDVDAEDAPMPRQKLSSVAYALRAAYAEAAPVQIPSGVIVMWSGAVDAVPNGWLLCNGKNGTPDLTDRFIVGAGGGYAVGLRGGSASNTISDHAHTIANDSPPTSNASPSVVGVDQDGNNPWVTQDHNHTVNAHNHGGGTGPGGSTTLDNRPPYYALAFIMKQ